MPVQLMAVLVVLFTFTSCYPFKKCAGELVFDDSTALCFVCPKDATYKNEACECKEGYEFVGRQCVLMDGAMPSIPDSGASGDDAGPGDDSGASAGKSCKDYCSFMNKCIGMNTLAPGVLPDVVMGLHATDAAACESSCKADLGAKETSDPALACIVDAQPGAKCDSANPQEGLMGAFGALGTCCESRKDNPLCKSICKPLKASPITASMVTFCN